MRNDTDRWAYRAAQRLAKQAVTDSRTEHLKTRLSDVASNPKQTWNVVKDLLHEDKKEENHGCNTSELADTSSDFFQTKLLCIRNTIALMLTTAGSVVFGQHRVHTGPILNSFDSVSDDEIPQLINKMPAESSPRAILPVSLLKSCADVFALVTARIVNLSLLEGCFPSGFKMAQVSPLLKKTGLDCTDPANYRPISNLSMVFKLLERLVLVGLRSHLLASVNFNPLQSAYRISHSTETGVPGL